LSADPQPLRKKKPDADAPGSVCSGERNVYATAYASSVDRSEAKVAIRSEERRDVFRKQRRGSLIARDAELNAVSALPANLSNLVVHSQDDGGRELEFGDLGASAHLHRLIQSRNS
jgi:hypothetical protein